MGRASQQRDPDSNPHGAMKRTALPRSGQFPHYLQAIKGRNIFARSVGGKCPKEAFLAPLKIFTERFCASGFGSALTQLALSQNDSHSLRACSIFNKGLSKFQSFLIAHWKLGRNKLSLWVLLTAQCNATHMGQEYIYRRYLSAIWWKATVGEEGEVG